MQAVKFAQNDTDCGVTPFLNKRALYIEALIAAHTSGQLITLADHERAVQAVTAERDFLRAENEAMREMSLQPVDGLLKSRMRELRERDAAVQAAVAKAVEDANDKIDGLSSDLESAVEVAYKRGATEWVRLNYPKHFAAIRSRGAAG